MRKAKNAYNFLSLAEDVLKESSKPLSIDQIWKNGDAMGLTEKVGSVGKTPVKTLAARLYIDLRDNEKSVFSQVSTRPSLFGLKGQNSEIDLGEIKNETSEISYKERDLHRDSFIFFCSGGL